MNSPKNINYETRPFKFTERKMLLASLLRICNYFGQDYQYIGFGGLAFSDFKLFHKELHIKNLISIEDGSFSIQKLAFNSPYSFINIIQSSSTSALNDIDLTKKSLVWLDYDGTLEKYMFDDVYSLFSKLPSGSIYIITCNRELKNKKTRSEYTASEFTDEYGVLVPFKVENNSFTSENNYKTIRKMFMNHISDILNMRNQVEDPLKFIQLYNLVYQEYRGANMFTFGGVVMNENIDTESLCLSDFDFIRSSEEAYKIEVPNLTRKEVDLINSYLFEKEEELLRLNIINGTELEKFKKTYKYLPNFYDVRI